LLERWARAPSSPQRLAFWCRIVLAAADGLPIAQIARQMDTTRSTVRLWLRRFQHGGTAVLDHDAPGRGRPRSLGAQAERAVARTRPGAGATEVASAAAVARQFGTSASTVRRIWRSSQGRTGDDG